MPSCPHHRYFSLLRSWNCLGCPSLPVVHTLWSVFQSDRKQMTVRHCTDHSRNHFSRPGTLSLVLSDNSTDLGHSVQMIFLGRGVLRQHHVTMTKLKSATDQKQAAKQKIYVKPSLNIVTFPAESVNSSLVKMLAIKMNIYLWYFTPSNRSGSKSK